MKTLKKTLCLVLALVMALSLMSVASAAYESNFEGYTDADEVGAAYVEAVDVLMGLGIVNGMSATEIGPEGYYTRAQAAKIATYVAVGPEVAEMLPAGEAFSDVPATHWAAKYINYCAEQGILNGVTATTYDPEANVTGYQFAKMILAAAGYGANDEFVGSGWAIATAQLALRADIDLFAGDAKAATNEPITRQQAMLIAFNGLDLDNVSYSKLLEQYVSAATSFYGSDITSTTPADDELGLAGYYWEDAEGNQISDVIVTDTLVAEFAVGTTEKAIAAALGIKSTNTKTAAVYENGVDAAASDLDAADLIAMIDSDTAITEKVAVYKTADGNFKFLTTVETFAQATVADEAETTGEYKGKYEVELNGYTTYEAKGTYTDEAYYIVVDNGTKNLSATLAKSLNGKVTGTGDGYIRIDGTKYATIASPAAIGGASIDYNTTTFTFYFDSSDRIVAYAEYEAPSVDPVYGGVLYLLKAEADVTTEASSLYGDTAFAATAKASVYFVDGAKTIDLAVAYNEDADKACLGAEYAAGSDLTDGVISALTAGWYRYEATDAGYILTAVTPAATTVTLEAGKADIISSKYADASTTVTVYNYDSVAKNITATTYTGIAGYPTTAKTYTNAAAVVVYNANNASLVKSVEIYTAVDTVVETDVNYAMFVGEGEAYSASANYQGFYVDGEYVEYKLATAYADGDLTAGAIYDITLNDKGELKAAAAASVEADAEASYIGSTYMIISDVPVYVAADVVVYNVATAGTIKTDVIAVGDTFDYIVNTDGEIILAFITAEA